MAKQAQPHMWAEENSPHKNKIHEKLHLKRKRQILVDRRMVCLVGPAFSYKADISEGKRKEGKQSVFWCILIHDKV